MSRITASRRFVGRACALLTLSLVAAVMGPMAPASAIPPDMPQNLSADVVDNTTTILSWEHVPNATRYAVTVDGTTTSTVNNSFVPTASLPAGTLNWSVTAYTGAEAGPAATSTFSSMRLPAPVLQSPASGADLAQPTNPPLLTWDASYGATSYKVEVDADSDFVDAQSYTTKNTSLVVPFPLSAGDWFWRVTAIKGTFNSLASTPRFFDVIGLPAPTITAPADDATVSLQDVVLDWAPVPGAASYDVQVSKESDFSIGSALIDTKTDITGTRYSPKITYDNASYFWRVRAIDMSGQATAWTAARSSFSRAYPQMPTAVYPAIAGIENVPAPLYFQWTSVKHASEYEIQVGTQENFSVGTFESCRVAGTTFTPGLFAINTTGILAPPRFNEDCNPVAGEVNYWRVRPLDRPYTKSGDIPGVQGTFSDTQAFRYLPLSITGMEPNGDVVDVPTLTWDTTTGAETYEVTIRSNTGSLVDSAETSATSYTPNTSDPLSVEDGPYTWRLTAVGADRSRSVTSVSTFQVSGTVPSGTADPLTPLTPLPSTAGIMTAPSLTWEPMPGAHHYRVSIGSAADVDQVWFGHGTNDLFDQPMPYPAMTDTSGKLLLPGTYDWRVRAYNSSGAPIGQGPEGRFTVQPIRDSTAHMVALGGQELDGPVDATPPCSSGTGTCEAPSTPVLRWDPDPRASHYMVYVATDPNFTNLLEPSNAIPATTNTMYAPALDNRAHTYADNQAGQSYYFHIRPCRTKLNCGPDPVSRPNMAHGTFKKRSPQVTGLASSSPSGNEITFSWTDYWSTNQEQTWAQTGELANQSAKQYRIEVDNDDSFSEVLDSQLVDQPTYTAFDRLYPEGTLYWRVQAVDSDDNGLAWSAVQSLTKQSPQVTLTSPVGNTVVPGTTAFRWQPQAFAQSYDIEIYANDDATFSPDNKVAFGNTVRNAAYVPVDTLPASDAFYLWRVRRTDADGNKGPWSNPGRFKINAGSINLIAPALNGSTPPNGAVLQWSRLTGAATYDVRLTNPSGNSQTFTTVATAYAPVTNLVTGTYTWSVTAKDASGNTIGTASSAFKVDAQLMATQRPTINAPEGTALGRTVTVTAPTWSPGGVGVTTTYQWLRNGTPISGQTSTSYTLVTADFGKSITVRATGKAPGYLDGSSTSLPLSPTSGDAVPNITPPTITGSPAAVGNRLTGEKGSWSANHGSLTYTYAWLRDGAPITGATAATYTPVAADLGTDLIFRVTASATGYNDGVAHSNPVRIVTLAADAPVQVSAPSGTGVGASLVGTPPVWNQPDVTTTYQWLRNGSPISGATITTHVLSAADFGKEISLRATGRKTGFQEAVTISNVVLVTAGGALQANVVPVVSGTAVVGNTLSVSPGTWSQPSPGLRYQWLRNGAPIPDATRTSYRLVPADAGTTIAATVLASKVGFTDGAATTVAVSIPKMASTTAAALSATRVKPGTRVKIGITVAVAGVTGPIGTIKVYDGAKVLKTLPLSSVRLGKISWKMGKLKPGKHKIKAVFLGNDTTLGSKSRVIKLIVAP